jgi:hypothetical protein
VSALLVGTLLGLLIGARHALEADHLAAVSTLVARERDPRLAARLGALWGLGHTLALVAVSGTLVVSGRMLSAAWETRLEGVVGIMLIALGAWSIARAIARGGRGAPTLHRHGGRAHVHPMQEEHVHLGRVALAWRPLAIGLVHGAAGSGALTALAAASLPTVPAQLAYLGLFGAGSIAGMAAVAAIAAGALARVGRFERAARAIGLAAGAASLIVGARIVGATLLG